MRPALAPVRWWIRFYTMGLPRAIRDERRAELESDLFEEWRAGSERGLPPMTQTRSIWARWLLGIPDDLAWRVELASARSLPAGTSRARFAALFAGIVVAIALVSMIVVVNTIQYMEGTQPSGAAASFLLQLAFAIAVVGALVAARGFRVMSARPAEGTLLAVGGSIVAGLALYWLILPIAAAVVVSVYALGRARSFADRATPQGTADMAKDD